jgi:hypothetical protein
MIDIRTITIDTSDPAFIKAKAAWEALEPREKKKFVDIIDWIFEDLEYIQIRETLTKDL